MAKRTSTKGLREPGCVLVKFLVDYRNGMILDRVYRRGEVVEIPAPKVQQIQRDDSGIIEIIPYPVEAKEEPEE